MIAQALARLGDVVGPEHVLGPGDDLAAYEDPYALGDPAAGRPAGVVRPATVDEVRQVVTTAAELGAPLWTVSRGRNLGYGGAAARLPGSIVLDLARMDRILEVDEELAYALVEPGVSFFALYDHLRERDLALWPSVPALGWGSVVGNTLERGFGYTSHGDHAQQQCGMEVVLADGDVIRTGMGAMSNGRAWTLFRGGYGPAVDGLFLQSNLGVVTKMGIWLAPAPEAFAACEVSVGREEDLAALVDVLGALRRGDVLQGNPVIGNVVRFAAMAGPRSRWYDGEGAMPEAVLDELRRELGVGWWSAAFGLYGPAELVDARLARVRSSIATIPDAQVEARRYVAAPGDTLRAGDLDVRDRGAAAGVPGLRALDTLAFRGADGGQLTFAPVMPCRGDSALAFSRLVQRRSSEHGFDVVAGLHVGGRHLTHIDMILFDRGDERQRTAAGDLCRALIADAAEHGYAEYRAHLDVMDLVAAQFDFNDHALGRLHRRLKDALDARGILSPGKQGVWPAGMGAEVSS